MIHFKKKSLILFSYYFLIAVVGVFGFFVIQNALNAWNDTSTWKVDSSVSLPVRGEGNYKAEIKELESGKTSIKIPFCVFFDVNQVSPGTVEYSCAALPYSSVKLTTYFPTHYKLNKDIVISYNEAKDPLPTEYIDRVSITKETITSVGSDPVPASIEVVISHKKPRMGVSALFKHYQKAKNNEQENYASTVIDSWKVTKIRTADQYSPEERKKIVAEWRAKAWTDINKVLGMESILASKDNREFVTKMGTSLAWRSVSCKAVSSTAECELSYLQNASTNIMYYGYAANAIDNKVATQLAEVLRNNVIPFVYQHNKKMGDFYDNCDPEKECAFYHNMQVYDYPVCPINELGKKNPSDYVKNLFVDLRYVLMGEDYIDRPLDYAKTVAEIEQLKKDFLKSGLDRDFAGRNVGEGVSFIDRTCLHLLYGEVEPDQRIIEKLRELYMVFVLGRTYIDEYEFANKDVKAEDAIFQMVLDSSIHNPYKYTLVPQPYASYQRVLTGVYKQDTGNLTDEYWTSLNSTLILLYLTGSN